MLQKDLLPNYPPAFLLLLLPPPPLLPSSSSSSPPPFLLLLLPSSLLLLLLLPSSSPPPPPPPSLPPPPPPPLLPSSSSSSSSLLLQTDLHLEAAAWMFYSSGADHSDTETLSRFILESDAEAEQEVIDLQGRGSNTGRDTRPCCQLSRIKVHERLRVSVLTASCPRSCEDSSVDSSKSNHLFWSLTPRWEQRGGCDRSRVVCELDVHEARKQSHMQRGRETACENRLEDKSPLSLRLALRADSLKNLSTETKQIYCRGITQISAQPAEGDSGPWKLRACSTEWIQPRSRRSETNQVPFQFWAQQGTPGPGPPAHPGNQQQPSTLLCIHTSTSLDPGWS
ncbi:unnamed protein product [Pleuronectes platessa]|uniref:Uncharacterized protein n=1 Tax=Pleuronectes platessa TaxID=8262 RepID=A0A9N7Y7T6_PLEPL|nr:unnamed protein product [Pleuronectes platessa]